MQKINVLAPRMKPIILIRAPVLNWELFMTGKVSFPTAGLAPLLLKMPSASFGPKKCCLPLLCREILAQLWGGEHDYSLGSWENSLSLSVELMKG